MKHRFILRKDGNLWRIYDRQQGKWRGKGSDNSVGLLMQLDRLNNKNIPKQS
jgi:hypothetical protein